MYFFVHTHAPMLATLLKLAIEMNLFWSVLNFIPSPPFDGGDMLFAILGPRRPLATALISGISTALCTLGLLRAGWSFVAAGAFGFLSYSAFSRVRKLRYAKLDERDGMSDVIAAAKMALADGDAEHAFELAFATLRRARTGDVKNRALNVIAWAHAVRGEIHPARDALAAIVPRTEVDPFTLAVVEEAAGERAIAIKLLEQERASGRDSVEMNHFLIDLYARQGLMDKVFEVARDNVARFSAADIRMVVVSLREASYHRRAAELSAKLLEFSRDSADAILRAHCLLEAGDLEGTLKSLADAIALGADVAAIRVDEAFSSLTELDAFRRLVEGIEHS
jgi:tetratricopeptide (TPR) repeat protein